jgi:hypothetical protein
MKYLAKRNKAEAGVMAQSSCGESWRLTAAGVMAAWQWRING